MSVCIWSTAANVGRWRPSDRVETPDHVYAMLNEEFRFTVDVCADEANHKAPRWFGPQENGLWADWHDEVCWCNPPYSEIKPWVRKAYESSLKGATTVLLLPVRSDLGWWHDYAQRASEIRFIRGRLRFKGRKGGAPFPVCLVIFRPTEETADDALPLAQGEEAAS